MKDKLIKGYYEADGWRYKYWKLNNCICDIPLKRVDNHEDIQKVFKLLNDVPIYNILFNINFTLNEYYYCSSEGFDEMDKKQLKNKRFENKFLESLK